MRGGSSRFPLIPPSLGSQKPAPALSRQVSSFQSVDEDTLDDLKVLLNSVVKIFVSSVAPNFRSPWTNRHPESSSGSGFILDTVRRIIVTNAHVATHGRTILLQKGTNHSFLDFKKVRIILSWMIVFLILIFVNHALSPPFFRWLSGQISCSPAIYLTTGRFGDFDSCRRSILGSIGYCGGARRCTSNAAIG